MTDAVETDDLIERERIVRWLRYLNRANRDPHARAALGRVLTRNGSTVGDLASAIERGDHIKDLPQ